MMQRQSALGTSDLAKMQQSKIDGLLQQARSRFNLKKHMVSQSIEVKPGQSLAGLREEEIMMQNDPAFLYKQYETQRQRYGSNRAPVALKDIL